MKLTLLNQKNKKNNIKLSESDAENDTLLKELIACSELRELTCKID